VGFTLPSAGLSPAPSDGNRKMAKTPFRSQVLFSRVNQLLCQLQRFFVSSRATPRDPGSFSTPADAPPTTDQPRRVTLELHSGVCVIQSAAKNPGSCRVSVTPLYQGEAASGAGEGQNSARPLRALQDSVSGIRLIRTSKHKASLPIKGSRRLRHFPGPIQYISVESLNRAAVREKGKRP
jgi:hypothetical protein